MVASFPGRFFFNRTKLTIRSESTRPGNEANEMVEFAPVTALGVCGLAPLILSVILGLYGRNVVGTVPLNADANRGGHACPFRFSRMKLSYTENV